LIFFDKIGQGREKVLVFFSMAEKRKKMHLDLMQSMQTRTGMLQTVIPYSADIERMGIYRQPVAAALPKSTAAIAYERLWDEIRTHLAS